MSIQLINFLIKIKNASSLKKNVIKIAYTPKVFILVSLLYKENIIQSFKLTNMTLCVYLKSFFNKSLFYNLAFLSTPSKKYYLNYLNLCLISNKNNFFIVSTDKGLKTEIECKKLKIGGKLLFTF